MLSHSNEAGTSDRKSTGDLDNIQSRALVSIRRAQAPVPRDGIDVDDGGSKLDTFVGV